MPSIPFAGLVYRYYSSFPSWLGGFDSRTLLHFLKNPAVVETAGFSCIINERGDDSCETAKRRADDAEGGSTKLCYIISH